MIYYHVELSRHDVVLAEGLPAESYLDTDDRASFDNGGQVIRLFADFSMRAAESVAVWEAKGCAPLVVYGPEVEAARHRLDALGPINGLPVNHIGPVTS